MFEPFQCAKRDEIMFILVIRTFADLQLQLAYPRIKEFKCLQRKDRRFIIRALWDFIGRHKIRSKCNYRTRRAFFHRRQGNLDLDRISAHGFEFEI